MVFSTVRKTTLSTTDKEGQLITVELRNFEMTDGSDDRIATADATVRHDMGIEAGPFSVEVYQDVGSPRVVAQIPLPLPRMFAGMIEDESTPDEAIHAAVIRKLGEVNGAGLGSDLGSADQN